MTYADVTANIAEWLKHQPRGTRTRLAAELGIDKTSFSHCMSGRYKFSVEQLLKLAELARAPRGWPLVSMSHAERLEALQTLLSKSTH